VLLVEGNALADIGALTHVRTAWRDGRILFDATDNAPGDSWPALLDSLR
jgi:hypothetical protein